MSSLRRVVQDAAAVFAAHDFLPCFHPVRSLRGHFHVATGANFVFECDNNSVALAREKTLETTQQIFVDLAGELSAFPGQVFQPRLQSFRFSFEVRHLPRVRFSCRRGFFFLRGELGFDLVGLLHQFELFVLDFTDFTLVTLNFMPHRLEFIVLARLILLGLEPGNTFRPRPDIELELLAIELDLSPLMLERFHTGHARGQLRFEILLLQRQSSYFRLDLLDLLLSILKNE